MPLFERDDIAIYYEERGSGFPVLLIAPGGMRSTLDHWAHAAIDPWESYQEDFRLIAMDQRNAGRSKGPLEASDPWGSYAEDQLALLDSLGVDRFMVVGCCIGGAFILKLTEVAPERVVAAVLEQPIGVIPENQELFTGLQRSWAEELVAKREDLDMEGAERFLSVMWQDDFVVSVPPDTVAACAVPMLVLPGIDEYHPTATGHQIAALAPNAELLEPWKDSPEHIAAATDEVRRYLLTHATAVA